MIILAGAGTSAPAGGGGAPPTGHQFWFEADSLALANDASVVQLTDTSGSNNHGTQAVSGKRATYKTNIVNGLPVVRFDATDDGYATTLVLSAVPYTIHALYAYRGTTAQNRRVINGSNNWLMGPHSGRYQAYSGGFANGFQVIQDDFVIHTVRQTATNTYNYLNGQLISTTSNTGVIGTLQVGASGAFPEVADSDVAAIIAYPTSQSDADIAATVAYLATKYAIVTPANATAVSALTDIADLYVSYFSDALTGFADNDPIGTITDNSGNSRNATATLTARPLYKTGQLNSLPAIRWDGVNDTATWDGTGLASKYLTIFIVERIAANKASNYLCGGPGGTGANLHTGWRATNNYTLDYYNSFTNAAATTIAAGEIMTARRGPMGTDIWQQGGFLDAAGTVGQLSSYAGATLGSSHAGFYAGDQFLYAAYGNATRPLKPSEIYRIRKFLATKYAITL